MLEELAQTDPLSAAALLESTASHGHYGLAQTLVQSWSASDPASALVWISDQKDWLAQAEYNKSLQTILINYAETDPLFVYTHLDTLVPPQQKDLMLFEIAGAWANQDPNGAIEWISTLADDSLAPEALTGAYARVMETYMKSHPAKASLAIIELDSNDLQMQLVPKMAAELATADLQQALDWLEGVPNDEAQAASLAAIARQAFEDQPQAAFDTLLSIPELYKEPSPSLADGLRFLASRDPQFMLKRIHDIPSAIRSDVSEALASAWLANPESSPEYIDWLRRQPPSETSDAGNRILANHYLDTSPSEALNWARNLSQSSEQLAIIEQALRHSPANTLPDLAGSIATLTLPQSEKAILQGVLDERLNDTFSTLTLP